MLSEKDNSEQLIWFLKVTEIGLYNPSFSSNGFYFMFQAVVGAPANTSLSSEHKEGRRKGAFPSYERCKCIF